MGPEDQTRVPGWRGARQLDPFQYLAGYGSLSSQSATFRHDSEAGLSTSKWPSPGTIASSATPPRAAAAASDWAGGTTRSSAPWIKSTGQSGGASRSSRVAASGSNRPPAAAPTSSTPGAAGSYTPETRTSPPMPARAATASARWAPAEWPITIGGGGERASEAAASASATSARVGSTPPPEPSRRYSRLAVATPRRWRSTAHDSVVSRPHVSSQNPPWTSAAPRRPEPGRRSKT